MSHPAHFSSYKGDSTQVPIGIIGTAGSETPTFCYTHIGMWKWTQILAGKAVVVPSTILFSKGKGT